MKNRITQQVARKEFDGSFIYKIFDLLDGEVVNLRTVRQTGDYFEYTTELSMKEQEFVYSDTIQELKTGINREFALVTLSEYEENLEGNIRKILEATALVDEDTIDIRSVGGHNFAFTQTEGDVGVPLVRYVFGDPKGRVGYEGPLPNDETMLAVLAIELVERPYDKEAEQVYQIGPNEYIVLAEYKGLTVVTPLLLQEQEDGELSWLSNTDLLKFIHVDEDGNAHLLNEEANAEVFPETKDAQDFLEEKTKSATERVIMTN